MIPPELAAAIEALIPPERSPRRLFVYGTSAMYEYYLAADGTVFERDLDSMRSAERVESASTVQEVYAEAARRYPTLAALATLDPAAPPRTFEDALRYPGHIVVAWDNSEPMPTTLIAFDTSIHGARRLASRTVAPDERDAVLDLLGPQYPLGASYGSVVWHIDPISGFTVHDATGRRTSHVRARDVAFVRSNRKVEWFAASGVSNIVLDDVEPALASRVARDFANWLGCPHEDNGVERANEVELAIANACRTIAKRNGDAPRRTERQIGVSVGRIGNSGDISVGLDGDGLSIDVTLPSGRRRKRLVRKLPAGQPSSINGYLEGPWSVRDIIREALSPDFNADPPMTLDEAVGIPDVVAAWDRGDSSDKTLRIYATGVSGARELMHVEVEPTQRVALVNQLSSQACVVARLLLGLRAESFLSNTVVVAYRAVNSHGLEHLGRDFLVEVEVAELRITFHQHLEVPRGLSVEFLLELFERIGVRCAGRRTVLGRGHLRSELVDDLGDAVHRPGARGREPIPRILRRMERVLFHLLAKVGLDLLELLEITARGRLLYTAQTGVIGELGRRRPASIRAGLDRRNGAGAREARTTRARLRRLRLRCPVMRRLFLVPGQPVRQPHVLDTTDRPRIFRPSCLRW